ncbi:hypothetical protein SCA6_018418 [Theobroma cacao]
MERSDVTVNVGSSRFGSSVFCFHFLFLSFSPFCFGPRKRANIEHLLQKDSSEFRQRRRIECFDTQKAVEYQRSLYCLLKVLVFLVCKGSFNNSACSTWIRLYFFIKEKLRKRHLTPRFKSELKGLKIWWDKFEDLENCVLFLKLKDHSGVAVAFERFLCGGLNFERKISEGCE